MSRARKVRGSSSTSTSARSGAAAGSGDEEKAQRAAEPILDHFLSERDEQCASALAALDPLTAAAAAIYVCRELDPAEIAEFLDLIESFEIEEP